MAKQKAPEELRFEEAFEELTLLVSKLELGDLPLEESMSLFERGQALAARCSELLENAELQLHKLVPDESGGYTETDFDPESG
jgi:exodeoxyribonuclease VII small subunit